LLKFFNVNDAALRGLVPITSAPAFVILFLSGFSSFAVVYHSDGPARRSGYLIGRGFTMAYEAMIWFLAIACPCTWRWGAVCDAIRFLSAQVYGKRITHLVSIRISTDSDKMRIGDIPIRSTLLRPACRLGCAEV